MGPRTRTRNLMIAAPGKYEIWSNPISGAKSKITTVLGSNGVRVRQSMSDTTGPIPYVPHNLAADSYHQDGLRFNGVHTPPKGGGNEYRFYGYNPVRWTDWSYAPTFPVPNWALLETKAIAAFNPSKPSMDLPVFLFELREFPRMLKELGDVLYKAKASHASGAYLSYSFGWGPLISDLLKLLDFQKEVSKRVEYLKRLSKDRGSKLSRVVSNRDHAILSSAFDSSFALGDGKTQLATGSITTKAKQKAWASARVELTVKFPDDDALKRAAANAAYGWNLSAASLWEALPWSWLIDYFANIGSFLDANRGYIPFRITDMCLMVKDEWIQTAEIQTAPGITYTGSIRKHVSKQRRVIGIPTPRITFERFLTPHMVAILLSLVTTKALRRQGL